MTYYSRSIIKDQSFVNVVEYPVMTLGADILPVNMAPVNDAREVSDA